MDWLESAIRKSIETKEKLLARGLGPVNELLNLAEECLDNGGKLLFCGNGGSSCDAAHAVGELVGWFLEKDRGPLPAIALGHSIPSLTAIANDAGYAFVFEREVEALGREGDLLVGITTSGGSENVYRALTKAQSMGLVTVALTGSREGQCVEAADLWVPVPSEETPRIQESHLLIMHLLCEALERR